MTTALSHRVAVRRHWRSCPDSRRAGSAQGFVFESTPRFDVTIVIEPSGDLLITETIVQEFGSTERHGIFRNIPNRLRYDDEFDRVYPIDLISVTRPRTRPTTSRPRRRTATS